MKKSPANPATHRSTAQQRIIRQVLAQAGCPLNPAEIHERAGKTMPRVGIATIYRALKRLLESGEIVQVDIPGEAPRYEHGAQAHHHHFKCNKCQQVYDVQGCAPGLEALLPESFSLTSHEITLFGHCARCV